MKTDISRRSDRRYHAHPHAEGVDVQALERALREAVEGEVRFGTGDRALYSTDSSNYRQIPIGVVVPKHVEDMLAVQRVCHEYGAPLTNRGGGTSLSGETTNVAVIMDSSKYVNRVLEVNPDEQYAWVEVGTINDVLREQAKQYGLDFGPDPSTHSRCTIGGNLGNNSCGVHSVMAGRTADNTLELDVVTGDGVRMSVKSHYAEEEIRSIIREGGRKGEIFQRLYNIREQYEDLIRARFPQIPRRVSGYNLDALLPERGFNVAAALVGTEGTCVTFLRAKLRLVPWPPHRSLVVVGYESLYEMADHVPEILKHEVMACEAVDHKLLTNMFKKHFHASQVSMLPEGRNFLLLEFGGQTREEADERARATMAELSAHPEAPAMELIDDVEQEEVLWNIRESGLGATAMVPDEPDTWPGWEDAAVAPNQVGPYLREFYQLLAKYDLGDAALYGHFGDGCIHCRLPFDLTSADGVKGYRAFLEEAADLVVAFGGSLSGEHGDGQQRAEFLETMYGPELVGAMREFKAAWDPAGRMNPGKVVDPIRVFKVDENLRLGQDYNPSSPATYFRFPNDEGSLERATLRCVGVGKCRTLGGSTMCPSFQVLREEKHSTRGRSRMLFEMLQGDVLTDGWKSDEVYEALDMCLSCKGCKNDCPINVDMATYKAEFLAHYFEGRLRPRYAYAMGLIMYHARLGAKVPGLANFALHAPVVNKLVKRLGGVHPDRKAPTFATQTFRDWFDQRGVVNEGKDKVVLFPDTFTNHFHVDVAKAVCEVLEAAGFQVVIPKRILCCGRPLFDYGMLGRAQKLFLQTLDTLREEIRQGLPMVVPEVSCGASFRDELIEMLPDNADARRLSDQTFTLEEFLEKFAPDWELPQSQRKVLVQSHCHHKSIMGMDAEQAVLKRMGVEYEMPSTGCCGLAGSWGFEKEKYDVSMDCGERVLFPAVRDANPDTVIVADGFSCRTQIMQGTERRGIHLAQFLKAHLPGSDVELPQERPERAFEDRPDLGRLFKRGAVMAGLLGAAGAGAAAAAGRKAAGR